MKVNETIIFLPYKSLYFSGNRDFTNQNARQFESTETEKGPGRERRHEPREKQSYGCERDDRGRAKLR